MKELEQSLDTLHDEFVQIISEKADFPVDFDEAWQWIGYFKKQEAQEMLEKNFDKDADFSLLGVKNTGQKGRPATHIMLTVDCFKAFCMLAQTEKGKEVRRYYIQLEKDVRLLGVAGAQLKHYGSADERRALVLDIEKEKGIIADLRSKLDELDTFSQWTKAQTSLALKEHKLKKLTKEAVVQFNVF